MSTSETRQSCRTLTGLTWGPHPPPAIRLLTALAVRGLDHHGGPLRLVDDARVLEVLRRVGDTGHVLAVVARAGAVAQLLDRAAVPSVLPLCVTAKVSVAVVSWIAGIVQPMF